MGEETATFREVSFTVKETAQEIRKALRERWPAVRFSLRMSRGTGYGWMDLSYMDGPREADVRALTDRFRDSYFDGMDDSTHSIPPSLYMIDGEPVVLRYSCNGVNEQRDYSPAAVAWAESLVVPGSAIWAHMEAQGHLSETREVYPGRTEFAFYGGRRILRDTDLTDGIPGIDFKWRGWC